MGTAIQLGGLTLDAPLTVLTSVLLGTQCALYYWRLRHAPEPSARLWGLFFLAMSVATWAGAPKHGLRDTLTVEAYAGVLWISGLGAAVSVYWAQRATFDPGANASPIAVLMAFQVVGFVGAAVAFGPRTELVVANTAVGLVPVMLMQVALTLRGTRERAWIAAGLSGSMLTAVAYAMGASLGPWLNHVDVSHLMMGVAFWMIARGAAPAGAL